jgi:hypothetical protein
MNIPMHRSFLFFALVVLVWTAPALPAQTAPALRAEPAPAAFRENKVEASVETGAMFDIGNDNGYTILPQIASIRWQLDEVGNEGWRRGNTEFIFSGYYHPIVDGPENRFVGAAFGPRYNFIQEGWKLVPYIESRVGFAFTDSTDVPGAQGQDFCFTFLVGTGARYLINERFSVALGALYQHISNGGLSEPGRKNNGLDAVGPTASLHVSF